MRDNKAVGTTAAVITLGSSLALAYCLSGGFGPHLDPLPHQAVGRVLAEQTLSLLKPGGQVTVLARDTTTFQNPASDIVLSSFRTELARAGVKIDSVQAFQVDPLRPVAVPSGDFFHWLKIASKGSVIVSLLGPPMLTEAQAAQLGEAKPAVVAFCAGPERDLIDLPGLFSRGLLQAAVVSKRPTGMSPESRLTAQQAFDRQFIKVTQANLAVLSPSPKPLP